MTKKDNIDSFFDLVDKGADAIEKTLKHAYHPDKVYSDVEDAEVVSESKSGLDPRLIRLRVELYTAMQTLKGDNLKYFCDLIKEVNSCIAFETQSKALKP